MSVVVLNSFQGTLNKVLDHNQKRFFLERHSSEVAHNNTDMGFKNSEPWVAYLVRINSVAGSVPPKKGWLQEAPASPLLACRTFLLFQIWHLRLVALHQITASLWRSDLWSACTLLFPGFFTPWLDGTIQQVTLRPFLECGCARVIRIQREIFI